MELENYRKSGGKAIGFEIITKVEINVENSSFTLQEAFKKLENLGIEKFREIYPSIELKILSKEINDL